MLHPLFSDSFSLINSNRFVIQTNQTQGLTKQNTHTLTCGGCSKLVARVLKCALPVTVPDGYPPRDAYFAAVDACLLDANDRVDWSLCGRGFVRQDNLKPNSNGKIIYVVVNPVMYAGSAYEVRA